MRGCVQLIDWSHVIADGNITDRDWRPVVSDHLSRGPAVSATAWRVSAPEATEPVTAPPQSDEVGRYRQRRALRDGIAEHIRATTRDRGPTGSPLVVDVVDGRGEDKILIAEGFGFIVAAAKARARTR